MNEKLMNELQYMWVMKFSIVILIAIAAVFLILKVVGRKRIKNRGMSEIANNYALIQKHDKKILKTEANLRKIRSLIENTPLVINSNTEREYLQYNLNRANIRIAERQMTADEYNAICRAIEFACVCAFILFGVFVNGLVGVVGIIAVIMIGEMLPKAIVRSIVNAKDKEISTNFPDLYLLLHYNMVGGLKTSIYRNLQACKSTIKSKELQEFIGRWMGYINESGEPQSVSKMAADYREIHEVVRLMRIVKQIYDGDDVRNELEGYRQELVNKQYEQVIEKQKAISAKATRSLMVVMLILVQAIISAMGIYLPDISSIGSLFG